MRLPIFLAVGALSAVGGPATLRAADENERSPIEYSQSIPDNCISQLEARLERGELRLAHEKRFGYLAGLLRALDVPVESQMLVFSKTSLQRHRISPQTPRAIYFNDQVYVGFCQSGDVLEVSAVDSRLGAVFYTVDQTDREQVRITRQTENCLICHSSTRTEGVPGHLMRSLYVDPAGQPILSAGSHSVDHTTPLEHRWGGWYVTGTHGRQNHLGNLVMPASRVVEPVDNSAGQNVTELGDRIETADYLAPYSDIVALLVLEHQALVHNRLTKANYTTRQALHYEAEMNRALGEPAEKRLESTARRIRSAGEELVEALLLSGETQLTAPVRGTSGFAEQFSARGPRDKSGRSLRELDLERRLFRYPCSCLIYSPAFDDLPREMRDYVWQRLWDVLSAPTAGGPFAHLSAADRRAIVEIVRDTKADLPEFWTACP